MYKTEKDTVPTFQDYRPVNLCVKYKELSAVIGRQKVYRKHRGDEGKVNPVDLEAVREYLHKDQQNGKDRLEGHSKW